MTAVFGVRFSDGGVLLAVSEGADVTAPAFQSASAQYVWDSPLKVALLRALPPDLVVIAAIFLLLALAPVLFIFSKRDDLHWLGLVIIFFVPVYKLSIQNVGVGDGLMAALVCLAAVSVRPIVLFLAFIVMGLWHPQQSFFIGITLILAEYCFRGRFEVDRVFLMLAGLAAAFLGYLVFRLYLGFEYEGRGAYMASRSAGDFLVNLRNAPITLLPLLLFTAITWRAIVAGKRPLLAWMFLLLIISCLTTDVTRVATLVALPIVTVGALEIYRRSLPLKSSQLCALALLNLVTPIWSWAGWDIFVWSDLASDVCKWTSYCL